MHMKTFRSYLLAGTAMVLLLTTGYSFAQGATPPVRPRITGISHVGYFVSDLPKSLNFWHDFLGFDESYDLKKKNSEEVRIAFININDHQLIELFKAPTVQALAQQLDPRVAPPVEARRDDASTRVRDAHSRIQRLRERGKGQR